MSPILVLFRTRVELVLDFPHLENLMMNVDHASTQQPELATP